MTEKEFEKLKDISRGKSIDMPLAFIIDSPWIPQWYGVSNIDFYTSDSIWLDANLKAIRDFPDAMFLPGFWSEYGMCTEPSAFGAKCIWNENNLPHAEKMIMSSADISTLKKPNVKTDGLLPFMVNRLKINQNSIEKAGHSIKFAVSRGPLNIASFLMGTTEFLMGISMEPDKMHALLRLLTDFIIDWLRYQKSCFNSIDGILILDDIAGFVGPTDYEQFALPYLKETFTAFDSDIRLFHNDAHGLVTADYLKEMGVNIFNFSFEHSFSEINERTGGGVVLLGNLPPRDVMALMNSDEVYHETKAMIANAGADNVLWSVGGGMPQGVSSENIQSFIRAVKESI